ncbi:MFS transporter [Saxibacter everestensis]|uniref:MFS transporter n=1 Tax=Saxibacter everestensis TaxID=2909229 RepID=A0ABY8QSC8_9MICO|nr:MFS transporter [Brevibacteriaceae bacterium ZFBP1038]
MENNMSLPAGTAASSPPSPSTRGVRRAGPLVAVLLLAGSAMPVLGSVLLSPVLPSMQGYFADTPGATLLVPMVLTIPALVIALCAPIAGQIADRVGRKTLLLVSMVLYTIAGTAPLWLASLGSIVASRVVVGLAEAAIMTICTTLITDYYEGKARDKYLGLQVLVASLSATLFFALGGILGSSGWRAPFWLYLSAIVIAVPMAVYLWEPARDAARARAVPVPWRRIAAPALVTLIGGVVFYALIVHLPYVLDEFGVRSVGTIGAAAALASAATAAGAISFRFLSGFGPRRLLPVAFGLAAVGLLILWFAPTVPVVLVGAVITSGGTGILLPTLLTWAVSGLAIEERGRGTGVWTGALYIGQFASPLILAGAAGAVGGLTAALGALGIVAAVAAVASIAIPRR